MKIKLYVDWQEEKILKEKECEEKILEDAKDREEDNYAFAEFLDNYLNQTYNYRGSTIAYVCLFNLSKEEREKIIELWKEDCLETARRDFNDYYEEIEVEI
jgi:hypothetical protein